MQWRAAMGIARIQVGAGSGELLDFLHVAPPCGGMKALVLSTFGRAGRDLGQRRECARQAHGAEDHRQGKAALRALDVINLVHVRLTVRRV